MKRKIIVAIAMLMLGIGTVAHAENWDEFTVVREEENVTILLDRVTGIQYIKTDSSICPRLFIDGTPYREECE